MSMRFVSLAYHRNGVMGRPFWAVAFDFREGERKRRLLAILFDAPDTLDEVVHPCTGHLAVIDPMMAATGDLGAPDNRWRGDNFEPQLRQWIALHGPACIARGALPVKAPATELA